MSIGSIRTVPFPLILVFLCAFSTAAQEADRIELPNELRDLVMKDDVFRDLSGLDESARNLAATSVDLNNDGRPELIVTGIDNLWICSATGNCEQWIYQKTSTGYRLLLRVENAQSIVPQEKTSKGFRDIEVLQHQSAFRYFIRTFRYDGKRYRLRECFDHTYMMDNSEPDKVSEAPTITRIKCSR